MRETIAIAVCFLALSVAQAAPVALSERYLIEKIGLTDAEHTRSTDGYQSSSFYLVNQAGQAAGNAKRYGTGGSDLGLSAWLHNGSQTINIGLTDSDHTSTAGYRSSAVGYFNDAGQAAGVSSFYDSGTVDSFGRSTWVYNGTSTVQVGLIDAEHTAVVDGLRRRYSDLSSFNQAGQAAGWATRYASDGSSLGRSAWVYNGSVTVNVGLADAEHTRDTDGQRQSDVRSHLNEAGQVAGESYRYGSNGSDLGRSAWFFNGSSTVNVGFTDTEHTRSTDGYRRSEVRGLNEAGNVAGTAYRFGSGGADLGRSAWLYNGASTMNIGLIDAEHTRSTDGYRRSQSDFLNEAGQVAGSAFRYDNAGNYVGASAWLYDGTGTTKIGLTDAEHTRDTDGSQFNQLYALSDAGQVAGRAVRFGAGGSNLGNSVWLYDGGTTVNIGLTDAEHTRSTDGYRSNQLDHFNAAGQAAGNAFRYDSDGNSLGGSAWVYDGTNTVNVGLTDAQHTRTDGQRSSSIYEFNDLGQAAGVASRYGDGFSSTGLTAWFYNGDITVALDGLSERSDGYAYSTVQFLSDDGLVFGFYRLFDEADQYVNAAFGYSELTGVFDLGLAVVEGFDEWDALSGVVRGISADGVILGTGVLDDLAGSDMAYKLIPTVVPVPAAFWLFASAMVVFAGFARKTAR